MSSEFSNLVGATVSGYELIQELGRGSVGVVFLACQSSLDRMVAFKLLLPEFSNDKQFCRNFIREARTAAQLDHPNIVRALDAGTTADGNSYFVMEYVQGRSLEDVRVDSPELITLDFLLGLSLELASALHYAWAGFHMIHSDIKPGNLMIQDSDHSLKLADLGLANVAGDQNGDEIMATPMYAAPEVITRQMDKVDVRSDIYSFGIMLYELVAGSAPFHGSIEEVLRRHVEETPLPLLESNPDADPELAALIDRMIAKEPDDRPQEWLEISQVLTRIRERLKRRPQSAADKRMARLTEPERGGNFFAVVMALAIGVAFLLLILLLVIL